MTTEFLFELWFTAIAPLATGFLLGHGVGWWVGCGKGANAAIDAFLAAQNTYRKAEQRQTNTYETEDHY